MSDDNPQTADGIDAEPALADLRLPPHVGEHLAALFGCPDRLATGAEWVAAIRDAFAERGGGAPTESDLCRDEAGPHSVTIDGETSSYVCGLDPLIVPYLRGETGTVESTTPVDGERVAFEIGAEGVTVDPDGAVISLGVARDAGDGPVVNERIYEESCPYIHAFASVGEYERWADGTDAAMTSLDAREGAAVARGLASALFDAEKEATGDAASCRSRCGCERR